MSRSLGYHCRGVEGAAPYSICEQRDKLKFDIIWTLPKIKNCPTLFRCVPGKTVVQYVEIQLKGDEMLQKYLICFLVSMVPLIELRGSMVMAVGMDLNYLTSLIVCVVGTMLPVPVIYFFARKVLLWGCDKKYIGKFFTFCIEKGEHGGQKLVAKAGRGGLFVALMLFVGIPLPGTGAWTGTLAASFLNMGFKSTVAAVSLGVIMAGMIMGLASTGVFSMIGL